jgi:hypothetical protein
LAVAAARNLAIGRLPEAQRKLAEHDGNKKRAASKQRELVARGVPELQNECFRNEKSGAAGKERASPRLHEALEIQDVAS